MASVGVLLVDYLPAGLGALVIAVGAVAQPVLFRLKHGRVWELRYDGSAERARPIGWAVIVPHPKDQKTWRLDITLHPLCREHAGWADALVEKVNAAADVFDVSVQSMDPHDEPVLVRHGYFLANTLLSRVAVLQRFSPAHDPLDKAGKELRALREDVSENRRDLIAVQRLRDKALEWSPEIFARPSADWDAVVMRRTGALWELARASAVALDGYVEFLSLCRLDPASFPDGSAGLDVRLDQLSDVLKWSAVRLRESVSEAAQEFKARGGEPLQWAQKLALLEIEALSLSGLVCAARRGASVSLAVIEPEMQGHVIAAARRVRRIARSLKSRRLFDTAGLVWWALAIAGDAFDLCGHRSGRLLIRRAVRKLNANELRHMVVIPRDQRIGVSEPLSDDPIERWGKLSSVKRLGQTPENALADLSATRMRRIGMPRGAEGLRQKRLRRAVWALTINNLLLILAGLVVWLFAISLRNMPSGLLTPLKYVVNELNPEFPVFIERPGSEYHFTLDLLVSPNLAREATLALLAVVITGAVAVAVASPRETSTRLWAQDRAWQLFIVMVGYGASTAALVLALAPLPMWSTFEVGGRAEALTALGFAILTTCAATSTSALQSRLDTWQYQRRSLTASLRLRRANDRLGPPLGAVSLVARAVGCFAVCLLPLWLLILVVSVFTDTSPSDFWWVLLTLTALNLIPMTLLTVLFVIKWANDWGLAGRVATAMLFALLLALLVYEVLYIVAFLTEDPYLDVFAVFFLQSPMLLLWCLLVLARTLARHDRIWTGPAAFALHISIRFARWSYQRSNA
jgi:hypothetical protein